MRLLSCFATQLLPRARLAPPRCGAPRLRSAGLEGAEHHHATAYHAPVLVHECVEAMLGAEAAAAGRPRVFVDGTLGGGGHCEAMCDALGPATADRVVGLDRDPAALAAAAARLAGRPAFAALETNFRDAGPALAAAGLLPADGLGVDGLLLDLGVSSNQIDDAGRGFAFGADGPLDMRMEGTRGRQSAADLINAASEAELKRILCVRCCRGARCCARH